MGVCTGDTGLSHFGGACTTSDGCFNGVCQAGLCKLAIDDPCVDAVACGTHRCAGNVCATCTTGSDCASSDCNGGICALPAGAPCAKDADCGGGMGACGGGYCTPRSTDPCTLVTCPVHACPNLVCASCTGPGDCYMGAPCTNGQCPAPPGTFCTPGGAVDCASGTCAPPAFLDFSKCSG
jgi:hypothetical protein